MKKEEIEMKAIEKYRDLVLSLISEGFPIKEAIDIAFVQMQMEEKDI